MSPKTNHERRLRTRINKELDLKHSKENRGMFTSEQLAIYPQAKAQLGVGEHLRTIYECKREGKVIRQFLRDLQSFSPPISEAKALWFLNHPHVDRVVRRSVIEDKITSAQAHFLYSNKVYYIDRAIYSFRKGLSKGDIAEWCSREDLTLVQVKILIETQCFNLREGPEYGVPFWVRELMLENEAARDTWKLLLRAYKERVPELFDYVWLDPAYFRKIMLAFSKNQMTPTVYERIFSEGMSDKQIRSLMRAVKKKREPAAIIAFADCSVSQAKMAYLNSDKYHHLEWERYAPKPTRYSVTKYLSKHAGKIPVRWAIEQCSDEMIALFWEAKHSVYRYHCKDIGYEHDTVYPRMPTEALLTYFHRDYTTKDISALIRNFRLNGKAFVRFAWQDSFLPKAAPNN